MVVSLNSSGLLPTEYIQLSENLTAEYVQMGEGETVILVPGLAGGVGLLKPLMEHLSRDHRVIAYQLRGEGRGLFERGYGFSQLVRDLDGLIDALRLERPGLVGVSFGGTIALEYATRNSHRLSFLAVQGAGTNFEPGLFGGIAREVLDRLPLPEDNPFINQFFRLLIGNRRREGDRFDFIVDRCWQTDQSVMAHRLALLDDYDIEEELWSIRVPTLVLAGERDVLASPRDASRLAHRLPRARLAKIKGAGHLAFVTHPQVLCQRIRRFENLVKRE